MGRDLIMVPTVLGDRCRRRSHLILYLVSISSVICRPDAVVVPVLINLSCQMHRIYNVLTIISCLSSVSDSELIDSAEVTPSDVEDGVTQESEENLGLNKALDTYKKLFEKRSGDDPLTDEESEMIKKRLNEIRDRDVVERVEEHEPVEIPCENKKITIGPPTLTRFEKARIMGARALQLSQGAPPFIAIPKSARISLDISMEELDQHAIPITIRRVLPNGDYQNIPITYFEK